MDYEQWAGEYLAEAAHLRERIAKLRAALQTATASETTDLNRRIALLYTMYLECRHTGLFLQEHPAAQRQRAEREACR